MVLLLKCMEQKPKSLPRRVHLIKEETIRQTNPLIRLQLCWHPSIKPSKMEMKALSKLQRNPVSHYKYYTPTNIMKMHEVKQKSEVFHLPLIYAALEPEKLHLQESCRFVSSVSSWQAWPKMDWCLRQHSNSTLFLVAPPPLPSCPLSPF